jgi:hypothetical protein
VRKHAILRRELPTPLRVQIEYGRRAKRFLKRALGKPTADEMQPLHQL